MYSLIGKTFGQYRVLEQIGAGGMATVFKAYQPSMDRFVAIKVLPPQLSLDAQFVKRFQLEAHAIARLEHAHILPVFDYGESDGIAYLVMRYILGGTLKEYMANGRLALNEIVRIIGQIASALDYAHRLGVIHRDVKPNNVLMGEDNNAYLTDFGLARMLEASQQLTGSGVGLGTPAYMSPEQGLGNKADHRSDIYSLGVILYEMMTGHVPYEAETPMAVVLKHINEPLPLPRKLAPDIPEPVELVILKAMAKEPEHRYQSAGEMADALVTAVRKSEAADVKRTPDVKPVVVVSEAKSVSKETPSIEPRRAFQKAPWMKFAIIGLALIIVVAFGFLLNDLTTKNRTIKVTPVVSKPFNTAVIASPPFPAVTALETVMEPMPTESVDGKRVFYCEGLTPLQICVHDIQSGLVSQITKDLKFEGQMGTIAWSPDGERLVFSGAQKPSAPEKLYRINADGSGMIQLTADSTYDHQAVWSPDGLWIAFARSARLGLIRPDGKEVHTVLSPPENCGLNAIAWSPDSRRIALMNICGDDLFSEVWLVNPDGSDRIVLYSIEPGVLGAWMVWSPDGSQIVTGYEINKVWHKVLLSVDGTGEPQEIDWQPANWDYGFWPQWGIQKEQTATTLVPVAECRVAYVEKTFENFGDIFVKKCDGADVQRVTMGRISAGHEPAWSPDGQKLVFDVDDTNEYMSQGLSIVNVDGSNLTPIISPNGIVQQGAFPTWSPDGTLIAFMTTDIYTVRPDGSNLFRVLDKHVLSGVGESEIYADRPMWSPDSKRIAFAAFSSTFGQPTPDPPPYEYHFYVINADGSGLTNLATFTSDAPEPMQGDPVWSPDGSKIAFAVTVDDRVMVKKFSVSSDGSGGMEEIESIPESWYPWYWPQWDRVQTPVAIEGQARDFAEPILKVIADRKPDFEDDFSTADKGWDVGNQDQGEWFTIQSGIARLDVHEKDLAIGHEALNRKDFVLQFDARVAEGDKATQLIVNFHNLSGEYWFCLVINSAGDTWNVDKRLKGQQPNLASGAGGVSPFGDMTRAMIVARGPRAAIYLNDVPVAYFDDIDFDTSGGTGLFCQSLSQAVCEFDNVKFWDLAEVPGLP